MARKGREEEEEEAQEEGKAFKKTFTKKSKKIGRAITFEDQPFKIEAVVERMQKDEAPCVPLNPVNRSLQVKTFQNWGNKHNITVTLTYKMSQNFLVLRLRLEPASGWKCARGAQLQLSEGGVQPAGNLAQVRKF